MKTFVEVKVTELYVQCAYPMRPDALAMSDCCWKSATSAVVRPDGMKTWRCEEHRGLIRGQERGPVVESIKREVKPQGKNIGPADDNSSWADEEI